jgi:hypothetical protein
MGGQIFKTWARGDMDWIDLAENKDRCGALVNEVMNIRFP